MAETEALETQQPPIEEQTVTSVLPDQGSSHDTEGQPPADVAEVSSVDDRELLISQAIRDGRLFAAIVDREMARGNPGRSSRHLRVRR